MLNCIKSAVVTFCSLLSFWACLSANAASVNAISSASEIGVGDTGQISVYLNLAPTEEASVFEGVFDIVGLGSIANVAVSDIGATWPNRASNILEDEARLSLTSNNDGTSSRLLARFEIEGVAPGALQVLFNDASFASYDLDEPPFIADLPLSNAQGEVLSAVQVVPLPGAGLFFMSALLPLLYGARRRLSRQ